MLLKKILRRIRSFQQQLFRQCRTYGAAGRTLLLRTNKPLWHKVAHAGRPSWDERNEIIARFIPAGSSVLDVGCGAQTLKQHLRPGCRYQPCDVIQSTPEVIFCDFNTGVYPEFKEAYDYVVCSGVLEYIRQPEEFLRNVPRWGRGVILSYNPLAPGGSKVDRLGNGWGWVNHFTLAELQGVFAELGLNATLLHTDKLGYVIYRLQLTN